MHGTSEADAMDAWQLGYGINGLRPHGPWGLGVMGRASRGITLTWIPGAWGDNGITLAQHFAG